MALVRDQVYSVIEAHQDVGITSREVANHMGRDLSGIKDAFTQLAKAKRITHTFHDSKGPRVYWPVSATPTTNGGTPDVHLREGSHAHKILLALQNKPDGMLMDDLEQATGLTRSQLNSGFRPLYRNKLIAQVRLPGMGKPARWYAPEHAPDNAVLIPTHSKKDKKKTAPPPIKNAPSVNSAMDAISTLAAERETYYDALVTIKQVIDNALQGN